MSLGYAATVHNLSSPVAMVKSSNVTTLSFRTGILSFRRHFRRCPRARM